MSSQHRQPPATSPIELFSVIFPFFFRNIRSLRKTCISILTWTLLGNVTDTVLKPGRVFAIIVGIQQKQYLEAPLGLCLLQDASGAVNCWVGGAAHPPTAGGAPALLPPASRHLPCGSALVAMETWRPREVECNDPTAAEHRAPGWGKGCCGLRNTGKARVRVRTRDAEMRSHCWGGH